MSNVESNAFLPASTSGRVAVSPSCATLEGRATVEGKARSARAFLIHLVSREIQLSSHVAGWLRAAARGLTERNMTELSADCVRLAAETWELREQLVALAHRLVARRNRGLSQRRINVMSLLDQPASPAMLAFIDSNDKLVAHGPAGVVLAVVSSVEQLLSGVVPLAIDLGGIAGGGMGNDDATDLAEVAEIYEARFARAEALRRLTAELATVAPECGAALRDAGDSAIEHYTQIIRESAELGEHLDGRRGSMC
jgi:hypothetical protein